MMRRRGPGLIRTMGRTAVVAGTATAVGGRVARRQQQRYEVEDAAQQQAAMPLQDASYAEPDYAEELALLARLREQNVITEDEFAAKKKQLLGL